MAPTLRNSRDFGTSKDQLEEEITPFRTTAEDRNAIRTAAPGIVGENGGIAKGSRARGQSPSWVIRDSLAMSKQLPPSP